MPKAAPLDAFLNDFVAPAAAANEQTDEALMLAYAAGDANALEQLYDRFADPLFRFFLRCTGNEATAGDFVQDVFISVMKSRSRYQPSSPFRHFIFRTARNRVITHWRRSRPTTSLDDAEHLLPDTAITPAQAVEDADLSQALMTAIAALPEEQGHVVLLRWEGDLTMEAIAEIQGVSYEAVKSRYRLAIAKLRGALAHD